MNDGFDKVPRYGHAQNGEARTDIIQPRTDRKRPDGGRLFPTFGQPPEECLRETAR
jgi:hypothetical protein